MAHSILVIVYHLIHRGTVYQDLGTAYFDQKSAKAVERRLVHRLEGLGYDVILGPASEAGARPEKEANVVAA